MTPVYSCGPSTEDFRPQIDFDLEENSRNDWLLVGKVVEGELPVNEFPSQVKITVNDADATAWDCFLDGGVRNLFSCRFVDVVGREALSDFTLLPAMLNGAHYYFLRSERPTDCLDWEKSRIVTFPHDPSRIMDIKHWAFRDKALTGAAKLFCIPEVPDLLLTENLARKIMESDLIGVQVEPLP